MCIAAANVAAIESDGHPWLNVGTAAALFPASILILRSRWARPTRRAGRVVGRWGSILVLVVGLAAFAGAVVSLAANTHPSDPLFVSRTTSCGSVLWPRDVAPPPRSSSEELTAPLNEVFLGSDCSEALDDHRLLAELFGTFGLALTLFALARRYVDDGAERRVLAHPFRLLAGALILSALGAGVLTSRMRHDVTLADEFNDQVLGWANEYQGLIAHMERHTLEASEALDEHDFDGALAACRSGLRDAQALTELTKALPPTVDALVGVDVRAVARHATKAESECIAGAQARDEDRVRQRTSEEFMAAAEAANRVTETLSPR